MTAPPEAVWSDGFHFLRARTYPTSLLFVGYTRSTPSPDFSISVQQAAAVFAPLGGAKINEHE